MAQFDWVQFYKECAYKLLDYRENRPRLVEIVKSIYKETGINMPTLEKDNKIVDIDPFTFFGLFNKSSMKESNRVKIITAISKKLAIKAPIPTAFDSIPVLNNQNATFYSFIDQRGNDDIENLWEFFAKALAYAEDPTAKNRLELSKFFDLVIQRKGNGNSKITMGLYWIAPDVFLNLDSRNEWYIYKSGKLPERIVAGLPEIKAKIPASKYFDITEKLRAFLQSKQSSLRDFKELSHEAWRYSEQVNQEQRAASANTTRSVTSSALADEDVDTIHYWIYSPGDKAVMWDEFYNSGIMAIGWGEIGDLKTFSTKDQMKSKMKETYDPSLTYKNAAHATWQFANEMKIGDIVFAKKGMYQLVGRGVVVSDYVYDEKRSDGYRHIRRVDWTHNGEWSHPGQAVMKTLTDITAYTEYVEKLKAIFEDQSEEDVEEEERSYPLYTPGDFLEEVFMPEEDYDRLVDILQSKKNVILQGAPGVGKTFAAKRLAYSIMGVKDIDRVMMVQFHQSYSYEDFIMGFRPSATGFELKKGTFYNFCKKAEIDTGNDYFFIIDEINRGNLSKIFGELFMLIENDKRGISLQLLYSDEKFAVPENVYIIGMMNTADRSLAMLDYALRRRFAFFEIRPGFETEGFRKYRMGINNEKFNRLISCVENLNNVISADESLGDGFCIGHSYFCNLTAEKMDDRCLSRIVEFELIPLLKEYWFDEPLKVKDWSNNLRSAIK
ncbi:MAG: AAA domain-containing protein [Clostridiaceae bacterium]|nr:AAA domain-containing protein [Clostridiaceae bacterium]